MNGTGDPPDRSGSGPSSAPTGGGGEHRRQVALAGHAGDGAAARAGLASADPAVRATALGALRRAAALTAEDLLDAFADGDATVRRRAADEAAAAPSLDTGAGLVALLADPDPFVAEAAAFALGEVERRPTDAVAVLSDAARRHDDVLVREAAAAALGSIGDPTGLDAVLAACDDVATVRRRAVLALAAFDGPEVEATLTRLAEDRDRQVRQAAEDLLRGWGL